MKILWPICLAGLIAGSGLEARASSASEPAPPPRIEVRSSDLLAVGTVHGSRMTIHLSRIVDNAPVRDAIVAVVLRGTVHSTLAEADGSYTLETPDLTLPGAASVQFQVTQAGGREELKGTLEVAAPSHEADERNRSRQLGWWVLNFAVCIGFLVLWRRRRKGAQT